MLFLKKLKKNKMIVLAVCVIVVSLVYIGIQKAIDNYNFENNSDIIEIDGFEESISSGGKNGGNAFNSSDGGDENSGNESDVDNDLTENSSEGGVDGDGKIFNEETDLVLEEVSEDDMNGKGDSSTDEEDGKSDEEYEENKIFVYVTGEVNYPGVVILNEGSRIVDAINAAGGTTDNANISKVNLVYVLEDGMKVNIPNNNDLKNNSEFEYITMNSGDGGNDDYFGSGSSASAGSSSGASGAGAGVSSGSSGNYGSASSGKRYDIVNINTATQTELETLPGIGPSLALKIINYRKENGRFSSIEQIKDVSGIGDSKFENLKAYITV